MTRQFSLEAWGVQSYELSAADAAALQATGLVRAELDPTPGSYRLRAGSHVGVAAGPDWELRVDSHLDVRNLMFLLCYARDPAGWKDAPATFADSKDLLSSTAWGFAAAAERALQRGLLRGYRRLEERSPVLRGRLRVGALIAGGGLPLPLEIVRDEYDIDTHENRMVLAAAQLLRRLPLTHPLARKRLRRLVSQLHGVTHVHEHRELRIPVITRLNQHYQPALVLADVVLSGMSLRADSGRSRSVTFSFELHRVFEHFLAAALTTSLGRRGARLAEQMTGWTLDRERALGLRPDLVVWKGGRCLTVLDAKFKRLDQDLGGDAYQLLAYLLEFGPPRGFLVSAQGEASEHAVRAVAKQLSVRPVNLDQEPEGVLRATDALAVELLALDGDSVLRGVPATCRGSVPRRAGCRPGFPS